MNRSEPERGSAGRRASWFALMASLMNLALVAAALQTKYLNALLVVDRGNYVNLSTLLTAALAIGGLGSLAAIIAFGKRIDGGAVTTSKPKLTI